MREAVLEEGRFRFYAPEETARDLVPIRDRIFDLLDGGIVRVADRIFNDPSWLKVIIQGALMFSNRLPQPDPHDPACMLSDPYDPRDELQPLFEILIEDGIDEVIHMSPFAVTWTETPAGEKVFSPAVAVGTEPTDRGCRFHASLSEAISLQDRLLFDRTGRWGLFASDEMFGLLGGEAPFIARFVEKSGGWDFIRMKADAYWQREIDEDGYEARSVPRYYALAGWDNPPTKRRERDFSRKD